MLPKFTGEEDANLFLRELKGICFMLYYLNVSIDIVQLNFFPFAVKDEIKKWMYSL